MLREVIIIVIKKAVNYDYRQCGLEFAAVYYGGFNMVPEALRYDNKNLTMINNNEIVDFNDLVAMVT